MSDMDKINKINKINMYLKNNRILLILLLGYVLLTIPFLSVSPPTWFDEGLLSEVAWHLVEEGKFAQPLWSGYLDYETFSTHPNYLYYFFLAISFKLFGLGVFQARLVSVISGFFLITFLHYFVRRVWSNRMANITTILLVLNPLFILSARIARQEMLTTLFSFLCVGLLILGIKEKKSLLTFVAGIFGTLTILTHLNGLFICFAGLMLIVINDLFLAKKRTSIMEWKTWKSSFYFLAGIGISIIPFALFVLLHLDIFIYQFFELWSYRLPSSSSRIITNIITEPLRWTKGITTPLSICVGVLGFIYCLPKLLSQKSQKKREGYLSIYVILTIIILCFTLFDYHKYYGYLLIVLPLFCILSGAMFTDIIKRRKTQIFAIVILFLLLLSYVGVVQYKVWRDRNTDYQGYCDQVKKVIDEKKAIDENSMTKKDRSINESIILADALFWFCFPEGNLRSIVTFIWIHQYSGATYGDIFNEQNIEYVILDPAMYIGFHQDALQFDVEEEYLETIEECTIIGEIDNNYYTKAKTDYHITTIYQCT
jgi:4-amino-4-deoxy-L-arabinose transferase-like glycosyltransferase